MLDDEYNDFEEMNDSKDITIPPLKKTNKKRKNNITTYKSSND